MNSYMQNVNQKYQNNFLGLTQQQAQQATQQATASMQGVSAEQLKQDVQDSYVASRAKEISEINPIQQAAITLPAWYALAQGMDVYAKHSRGDYEKSIQYKITNAGDRVTNFVKNSSFGKSDFASSINDGFKSFKKFFRDKIVNKSAMLRAMAYTPSKPELEMVRGQANGMFGIQLFDYPQVVENFMNPVKYAEDLNCYGADKSFIDNIKLQINGATTKEAKATIIQNAEFELLGKDCGKSLSEFKALKTAKRAEFLKELKVKAFGYKDMAHWNFVKKDIQSNLHEVIEACHNAKPNMFSKIWKHDNNVIGKTQGHLFGREVYASEFKNKLLAEMGTVKPDSDLAKMLARTGLDKYIPKSGLGRFMGKYVNLVTEGLTNRVAGGKLVALMQAWFIAEAIIKTARAEKGDKVSTFAERMTEMVAFFAAMPLAIQLMHKVGGLQYAGMKPEDVAKYRETVKAFNEKVTNGLFKDKATYKAERDILEKTLKGGKHNIFTNLAKRVGRVVTVGLEQIRPYSKHVVEGGFKGKIKDFFRNPKYWFKQGAGYPVRIGIGMMMILPFLSKTLVKGTHLIFGKPKNSVLDEGKEDKKAEAEKQAQATIPHQITPEEMAQINQLEQVINQVKTSGKKLSPQEEQQIAVLEEAIKEAKAKYQPQTHVQNSANIPMIEPNNLLDKYKNLKPSNQTQTSTVSDKPKEPVRTYIPSPEPVKILNPERAYVPSPIPVQVNKQVDTSAADNAMMRADAAEKMVMQTLAMK